MLDSLIEILRQIIGSPGDWVSDNDSLYVSEAIYFADCLYFLISGVLVCLTVAFVFKFILKLVDR